MPRPPPPMLPGTFSANTTSFQGLILQETQHTTQVTEVTSGGRFICVVFTQGFSSASSVLTDPQTGTE